MLNMIRMDIYRMVRSKSFSVCLGILTFTTIIVFGLLLLVTHQDWIRWAAEQGMPIGELADSSDMDDLLKYSDIMTIFHTTNISGGFLSVTTSILAALFICVEFEGGFIKNIVSSHKSIWNYIFSKIVCLSLVNLFYIVATYLVTLLLNLLSGNTFLYSSLQDVLFYGVSVWMLCNGFTALTVLICMFTRSKAAACTSAICLSSGLLVTLIYSLMKLFGTGNFMNYTLYNSLSDCPFSYQQPSDIKALVIGIVFTLLYTVISGLVFHKKDVC